MTSLVEKSSSLVGNARRSMDARDFFFFWLTSLGSKELCKQVIKIITTYSKIIFVFMVIGFHTNTHPVFNPLKTLASS